ncbi:MAG: aminotransferase class V-fold PLP-dependent enzyme [Methylococcaceae bacterium]|nr:aminotransferase class V-fold PLP-dependent enzyme [Methylococcaceae bacterium]
MDVRFPVYLDYAATTPIAPQVIEVMTHYLGINDIFANPSSTQHSLGLQAEQAVENARTDIARCLNCNAKDIVFTSGATEANNLAIKGIAYANQHKGKHIITAVTEHKAVLDSCKALEQEGFSVTYLRPDSKGKISLEDIEQAITPQTLLISIMQVNNETGYIQDIAAIAELAQSKNILFHVDAAQAAGKLSIDLSQTPIDLLSISGHKLYAPKGIGCLYIRNRKNVSLKPLFNGGGQEYGLRAGTLATHQIVAFAKALTLACENLQQDYDHALTLRNQLLAGLASTNTLLINSDLENSLPNIVNISFKDIDADMLLVRLQDDIAISSASACSSGAIEPSYVLRAMGIEGDRLYGAVRISFGRFSTTDDIEYAIDKITTTIKALRELL